MLVDYHVRLQNESEIEGRRWRIQEYHYTLSIPIVALLELDTKHFLWRADAQGIIDPFASGDKQAQDIRKCRPDDVRGLSDIRPLVATAGSIACRSGQSYGIRATTGRTV
jgi:hypothetical protein